MALHSKRVVREGADDDDEVGKVGSLLMPLGEWLAEHAGVVNLDDWYSLVWQWVHDGIVNEEVPLMEVCS